MDNTLVNLDNLDLIVNDASSWEELVSLGMVCREYKDKSQWLLGKLALKVETDYGSDSLGKFASEIGVRKNSLYVYRWVVKAYEENNNLKETQLPFSAYQVAAGTDNPSEWINKAADGDWSFERLMIEVKKDKNPNYNPNQELLCIHCGKPYNK